MDFGGNDPASTAELAGDKDRYAGLQLLRAVRRHLLGHFDLAARRFGSLCRVGRVGCWKRDQQQGHRLTVPTFVLQGVGDEHPAEKQAVEDESRIVVLQGTPPPLSTTGARRARRPSRPNLAPPWRQRRPLLTPGGFFGEISCDVESGSSD